MVRRDIIVHYIPVAIAIYACISLPGSAAFVGILGKAHVELSGCRQLRTFFCPSGGPSSSLSSSLGNNHEANSIVNDGGSGLDHSQHVKTKNEKQQPVTIISDRRNALLRVGRITLMTTAASAATPSPALALKKKNEALCGTGFFEHIYEYKCTEIGDIQDEGTSKAMSEAETGMTNSLMGKLGFDTVEIIDNYDENKADKKTSGKDSMARLRDGNSN